MVEEAKAARERWAARNPERVDESDPFNISRDHQMPSRCPKCSAVGKLRPIAADTDQMSDGEEADYEAGVWGVAFCTACGGDVLWGV
jgi:hypothetical protein